MIKSIFVDRKFLQESIKELFIVDANHFIVDGKTIELELWEKLMKSKATMAISISSFDVGGCPLSPDSKERLRNRIENAIQFRPDEIWFDHFRFDGHWEKIKDNIIPEVHKECDWCMGKNRAEAISDFAKLSKSLVPGGIKIGYFAVPFKKDETPDVAVGLGQDHQELLKVFDLVSPMLYHRMINKPTDYISQFVSFLGEIADQSILPIVQIKDMPDNLEDSLTWKEFKREATEAVKLPSKGVCIFYWAHAVEKGKVDWIRKVFLRL